MKEDPQPSVSVGIDQNKRVVLTQGGGAYLPLTTSYSPRFARYLGKLLIEAADFAEGLSEGRPTYRTTALKTESSR